MCGPPRFHRPSLPTPLRRTGTSWPRHAPLIRHRRNKPPPGRLHAPPAAISPHRRPRSLCAAPALTLPAPQSPLPSLRSAPALPTPLHRPRTPTPAPHAHTGCCAISQRRIQLSRWRMCISVDRHRRVAMATREVVRHRRFAMATREKVPRPSLSATRPANPRFRGEGRVPNRSRLRISCA